MVSMKSFWSSVRLSSGDCVDLVVQLDVELHAAHAREVVLARVEEHALEQLRGGVERGRIAGAQLAVDFEQRVVLALDRIFPQGDGDDVAGVVALREEDLEGRDAVFHQLVDRGGELVVGFHQHFAGGHVDHVGGDEGALQIGAVDFHLLDLGLLDRFEQRLGDLAALRNDGFVAWCAMALRKLQADAGCRRLSRTASCP